MTGEVRAASRTGSNAGIPPKKKSPYVALAHRGEANQARTKARDNRVLLSSVLVVIVVAVIRSNVHIIWNTSSAYIILLSSSHPAMSFVERCPVPCQKSK